jgi:hypothetical protein
MTRRAVDEWLSFCFLQNAVLTATAVLQKASDGSWRFPPALKL